MQNCKQLKSISIIVLFVFAIMQENIFSQTFSVKTSFAIGTNPSSVAIENFNRDAKAYDIIYPSAKDLAKAILKTNLNNPLFIKEYYE